MAKPFSKTVIHNTDAKLSKQVRQPLKTNQGIHRALTWRVVDIAVGAAVGVMSGVMFWVFDGLSYGLFPLMTLILPGSAALLHALFYFPATLGVLKAGAAADIIVMDYKPFTPFSDENIDGHMIFGMTGRQCQTTIAAGKTLMLDRQLVGIDEEAENAHILEAAKKLWGSLNHCEY